MSIKKYPALERIVDGFSLKNSSSKEDQPSIGTRGEFSNIMMSKHRSVRTKKKRKLYHARNSLGGIAVVSVTKANSENISLQVVAC